MSNIKFNGVESMARGLIDCASNGMGVKEKAIHFMLLNLARRLRQEEEENRRDPVMDPRPGDRIQWTDGDESVWTEYDAKNIEEGETLSQWKNACRSKGSTIIRRREVQQ